MDTQIIRRYRWPMPHNNDIRNGVEASHPPGHLWLEIVQRQTPEAFAKAFTREVVLETSITTRSIVGTHDIGSFFEASRTMYDAIRFTHETTMGSRTCLEWEGTSQGEEIAGTTILAFDAHGTIERVQLYHRPYGQVVAYAKELGRRLAGKLDPAIFPKPT
jgi:hypothetical protein